MFALALLIGIYSYLIFILGILGILDKVPILSISLLFIILSVYYFYSHKEDLLRINLKNKQLRPYLILFPILAFVNLFGALAPEYSFDALWYHLTLPKIFIQNGSIFLPPNGIFYYSMMPKLGEMLFTPFVAFDLETFAKLIQWTFGILTTIVIYKISRRSFDEKKSFFAVLIFYGSLIVSWESTVAYVDLIRAFFEVMGLWGFLIWKETKDRKILVESAIFIGLAISTKLLALGSLFIFLIPFFIYEKDRIFALKKYLLFVLVAILGVLPWFVVSILMTGNPFYPVFSGEYPISSINYFLNPTNTVRDLFILFFKADIPISPLFIIFLPLVFVYFKKLNKELKFIAIYSLLAILVWYFIPRTGGGRFILPYLPAFSILSIGLIESIKLNYVKKYSYILIIFVFIITIFYRGIANFRYIPVVFGLESKDEFLTKHLNFKFGDFYDTDGYLKKTIKNDDVVLLFGFHNLYYADFPFIHESFVKNGDSFNYIATQGVDIPERFKDWNLIYVNNLTGVKLYSKGGLMWHY